MNDLFVAAVWTALVFYLSVNLGFKYGMDSTLCEVNNVDTACVSVEDTSAFIKEARQFWVQGL